MSQQHLERLLQARPWAGTAALPVVVQPSGAAQAQSERTGGRAGREEGGREGGREGAPGDLPRASLGTTRPLRSPRLAWDQQGGRRAGSAVGGAEAGPQMEQQQQQQGLGGAGGPGAAGAGAVEGPGLDEETFELLLEQAYDGETAAVLAAVEQDKRLATRADEYGCTLLHRASQGGHVELAGGMLDRGASLSAKNAHGGDSLYFACVNGRLAVAALLLDRGADPNTSSVIWTALGYAACFDNHDVCLLLLSRSADLMAPMPGNGRTALKMYGERKHPTKLRPAELAARRAALVAAWEEGPHPSQVQRRKDVRWARRWAFVQVMVGHGFRPLAYRVAQLEAAALPPSAEIPPLTDPRPVLLRDKALASEGVFKCIASFL